MSKGIRCVARFLSVVFVPIAVAVLAVAQQIPISNEKRAAEAKFQKIELLSPWIFNGTRTRYNQLIRPRNCFDLVTLENFCSGRETLGYGNRIGDHWDIFDIASRQNSRTRMIDLGEHSWNDNFTIPQVEPWPALAPGERRNIIINTSGADGSPGRNGDGTYDVDTRPSQRKPGANAPLNVQVTSTILVEGKAAKPDSFSPMTEAKFGHMYLVHVVNSLDDHYVLLRVDGLVRGEKLNISFLTFRFVEN